MVNEMFGNKNLPTNVTENLHVSVLVDLCDQILENLPSTHKSNDWLEYLPCGSMSHRPTKLFPQ